MKTKTEIAEKTANQSLMELYLNSLLSNTELALPDEVIVQQDIVTAKANISLKVLCFQFGEITIATPMLGIYKVMLMKNCKHHITQVPGYSINSHGVLTIKNKNFDVINVAHLICTKEQQEKQPLTLCDSKYLLLISDTAHAVMCQTITHFKEVSLAAIRKTRKSLDNPWHIGTIISDMVPIIDLPTLIKAVLPEKC